jgi:hypothetical protein
VGSVCLRQEVSNGGVCLSCLLEREMAGGLVWSGPAGLALQRNDPREWSSIVRCAISVLHRRVLRSRLHKSDVPCIQASQTFSTLSSKPTWLDMHSILDCRLVPIAVVPLVATGEQKAISANSEHHSRQDDRNVLDGRRLRLRLLNVPSGRGKM